MGKCIICGRELTTGEPLEMYNGMCVKCHIEQNFAEYPFKQGIYDYQQQIDQLKQQLTEKNKEINIKNNKLCELKKQLQNCQNEIIRLKASNKNLMSVIWKTKRERANKGRQVCQSQNESIKYKKLLDKSEQNQTQLAIQELAEVERLLYESHYREIDGKNYAEYEDIKNLIYNRIKGLERRENDD